MILFKYLLYLVSYLGLPYFIYKLLIDKGEWRQRLSLQKIPQVSTLSIWLHAASVGEINAVIPVIKKLTSKYPKKNIYITTMTKTGYERAAQITRKYPNVYNYFIPIDLPFAVKNFIKKINPEILIITETELWPLLIHYTKKRGSKLVLINGRMTEKSWRAYKLLPSIFSPLINSFDKISVQTDLDKFRFKNFTQKNVEVAGNIKFAVDIEYKDRERIKKSWGIENELIISLGSSRPGEEELVVELHKFLREKNITHQIIIAPRHLERIDEVKSLLVNAGIDFKILSQRKNDFDLLLIDKMGVLVDAYAISDIAIIGGSFYDYGGHNPLEAAYFGLPIIMGNYHSSCKESVEILKEKDAIIICQRGNLSETIYELIQNNTEQRRLGRNARKTLKANEDSLDKTINLIDELLTED